MIRESPQPPTHSFRLSRSDSPITFKNNQQLHLNVMNIHTCSRTYHSFQKVARNPPFLSLPAFLPRPGTISRAAPAPAVPSTRGRGEPSVQAGNSTVTLRRRVLKNPPHPYHHCTRISSRNLSWSRICRSRSRGRKGKGKFWQMHRKGLLLLLCLWAFFFSFLNCYHQFCLYVEDGGTGDL